MYKPGLNRLRADVLVVVCCRSLLFRALSGVEEQHEQKQEARHQLSASYRTFLQVKKLRCYTEKIQRSIYWKGGFTYPTA